MRYAFDDAGAAERARDAVLRDVLQPRHLPQGLDRGHAPLRRRGIVEVAAAAVRRRHLGALRHQHRLDARRTTSRPRCPTSSRELQRAVHDRGAQVQRAAARRPARRALQLRPRRPARRSIKGNRSCSSAAWDGSARTRSSTSRTSRTRSPPRSTVPDGGAEGVIIAQGGAFGGWSLYLNGRQADVLLQPLRRSSHFHVDGDAASRRATIRCAWSSTYDGGGLGKGGTRRALPRRRRKIGEGRIEAHRPDGLLRRRDLRPRLATPASPVSDEYTSADEHVHRHRRVGAARHRRRRRRPRPPDHARGATQDRHDEAVRDCRLWH